ncbi:MAG: hypothetical protein L6Q84_09300 [Polyangiaceae bacterium]|nr:hypothetical protein [Polyangiaceae bacterium]
MILSACSLAVSSACAVDVAPDDRPEGATEEAPKLTAIRLGLDRGHLVQDGQSLNARLRALHVGEPALLHAVPRADQAGFRTVIGRFPALGKSLAQASDQEIVQGCVDFLNAHRELFGLSRPVEADWLELDELERDDALSTVRFFQARGGVRIADAGVTFTFYSDGALYSVAGQVEDFPAAASDFAGPAPSLVRAGAETLTLERDDPAGPADRRDTRALSVRLGGGGLPAAGRGVMRPAIDRVSRRAVWLVEAEAGERLTVDAARAEVVARTSSRLPYTSSQCEVRRGAVPRTNSDGRADWVAIASNDVLRAPSVVGISTCGADEWFGNCPWQLKRTNVANGFARVLDDAGGEVEDSQACSDPTLPRFASTSTESFFEENAFAWLGRMRTVMNTYAWGNRAPNDLTDVNVHVRYENVLFDRSHYHPTLHDINIHKRDNYRLHALFHEYGHYVAHSYGLGWGICFAGISEGERITETLADFFFSVQAASDSQIQAAYNASLDTVWEPHVRASDIVVDDTNDCNASDVHDEGRGLNQALWELLFNRDCTVTSCRVPGNPPSILVDVRGPGNDIWRDTLQNVVISNVTDAVVRALKNTNDDTTYDELVAQMSARWTSRFGADTAGRAMAVLAHHGR